MADAAQVTKVREGKGFIAALDQSGGSTPKALSLYGIEEDAYSSEDQMFDLIHEMRSRIVMSPAFGGDRIVGAILFEMTMDRDIGGKTSSHFLWEDKQVVPFLKVDKGLEAAENGVQLMKSMGDLDGLLKRAVGHGVFGTKMRSVIGAADRAGIKANVAQQFEIGQQILGHGLIPILEPEVTITIADKAEAEAMLLDEIMAQLDAMPGDAQIMLKLSLPTHANHYAPLVAHDRVMRVVALSGGYSRDEANALLAQNAGVIASFSRGLTEGLSAQQSDAEFDAALDAAIQSIYDASVAG
ncbi:fructose bisphosphate aldolase [Ponticoccus sp. SC2-23]|uniref:fructose bisphosphate aldolase n=1 Tax=Alexandriicola marinus TaxID=2081710 RepID=UPI000FD887B2|nr:fructose bisphosphate aldolase [Alexandriicola marinus]MBM1222552.1 fructose bisphosphate aldolase [Ponticoccus sp. SC6-9]MBM1227057.1 fructose bisphosphate aldolase [Ponticoccus sp. SC6-15]MBM1231478.1 fructose bisphosphate aldolase [Ponticoccus sp. SC6-38]MBM1236086.1 fructose bisphosphate aldolase [Ponticoccus sp. SC6-45]MBM1240501.1 fructose bisphosphate aldolase [Ponticoccus sp. SC6-49]MBM1245036.1 fructose bisphosphate aldolase [Ponticoccus sp. SC2-64]MBM1249560.1 fructose bisphosph